jgi:predicted Zn-dependent peptidase
MENINLPYQEYKLDNGIRLIHQPVKSMAAHCGLIINAGSRDEKEKEHGMAHFIEHLLFKGTRKRKSFHIFSRMEDVGGEVNAYTTKEETCVYTSFLKEDIQRALDLISDIVFNSLFPAKEIEKEKEVVLDEINSYLDSPAELIFDEFEEMAFGPSPVGRNVLGNESSISGFTRENLLSFMQANYKTDQMVLSSAGDINFDKLCRWVEKYFGAVAPALSKKNRNGRIQYKPRFVEKEKNTHQAHCIMGSLGYEYGHEKRLGLVLLNNLLGGPGLNSRLNLLLREKHGHAYNIESNYTAYSDTGILSIYFGTEKRNLNKCLKLIRKELSNLISAPLGTRQLQKAKRQLKGQLAIHSENYDSLMLANGKARLLHEKVESLEEIYQKIDRLESSRIQEIARESLAPDNLSTLIYK